MSEKDEELIGVKRSYDDAIRQDTRDSLQQRVHPMKPTGPAYS
jgi:hypothetical protein